MRRIFALIPTTLLFAFAAAGRAQVGITPAVGFDPYGTFQSSQIDNVNVSNGNVVVKIPLFSLPQKGAFKPITYSIISNTMPWTAQMVPDSYGGASYDVINSTPVGAQIVSDAPLQFPVGGGIVNFINSSGYPDTIPQYTIQDYSGAQHALIYNWSDPTELRTVDGSGYRVKFDGTTGDSYLNSHTYDPEEYLNDPGYPYTGAVPVTPVIFDPNGIKTNITTVSGYNYYNSVSDLDGNTITFPTTSANYTTDTIGRTLYSAAPTSFITTDVSAHCPTSGFPSDQPAYGYTVTSLVDTYGTTTGDPRYTYTICYVPITYQTNLWGFYPPTFGYVESWDDGSGIAWNEASGGFFAIQSVVLPDGTYWGFVYDNATTSHPVAYGNVTKILNPTGGAIAYCYVPNSYAFNVFAGIAGTGEQNIDLPLLTKRAVESVSDSSYDACSSDSLSTTSYWTYNITPWMGDGYTTATSATVTDPAGKLTSYTFDRPGETSESVYNGSVSGTPLKSTSTTYSVTAIPLPTDYPTEYPPISAFPSGTSTVLNGTTVGSTASTYGGAFSGDAWDCPIYTSGPPFSGCIGLSSGVSLTIGQLATMTTYNGSSGLLNYSEYSYQAPVSSSSYWGPNLIFLKSEEMATDGTNSKVTYYCYDETSPSLSETSCSSPGTILGHLTTAMLASGSGIDTHTSWNLSGSAKGMPSSTLDPKGNATSYSYDSTGLYPSTITYADGETDAYTYDDTSGEVTQHVDSNSKTTNLAYDAMRRPWSIQYPDAVSSGNQSEVACYPNATTVTVYQAQGSPLSLPSSSASCPSSSTAIVKTENVDGLGRTISTILNSAPEGPIETDTTYDAVGRVYTVSNPYIAGGTAGPYTTYYPYDALSRIQTVTHPTVGSVTTTKNWSYSVLSTTVTDENSNETTTATDFLGRMTDVYEPTAPSTTPTLHTSYSYNVYGLTGVSQYGSMTRSFSYDSLARLTSAANPETGTVSYSYTASGSPCAGDVSLPCSKTDARSVTTNYTYDSMNRKTYSGSSGALTSCYLYGTSGGSTTNGIGRLVSEWTQTGTSCSSPSGQATLRSVLAYDPMGRITQEKQCVLSVCTNSTPPGIAYNYDLAGNVVNYTSGIVGTTGEISFANQFDTAGRLLTVTSSWDDLTHPGLLWSVQSYSPPSGSTYNPSGLTSANLGNHLNLQRTYDPRLRVSTETVLTH